MEKKNYIVGIDVGTSNIVIVVGSKEEAGDVKVEAIVSKPARGVNAGVIDNYNEAGNVIREAKQEIEEELGIRITEAYAGLSGAFVRCDRYTDHVFVKEPREGVTQRDVENLAERMRNVIAPETETIIERIPQNYMVDGGQEIKSPVGTFGRQLSSTFNFILCDKTPLSRLEMTFRLLGIKLLGIFANALIMPDAVLSSDEKEDGVAVVDLGGGTTDVAVVQGNVVRYIASIPMGANVINRDIAAHGVPERSVEKLKKSYGSAIAEFVSEQKLIQIPSMGHRTKGVMRRNLAAIIEARLTDIAEYVKAEIKDSGYAGRIPFGIVLTGGSASMEYIDELFRRVTGYDVRVATAQTGIDSESQEKIATPAHTAAVALLLAGAKKGACAVSFQPSRQQAQQNTAASETTAPAGNNVSAGTSAPTGNGIYNDNTVRQRPVYGDNVVPKAQNRVADKPDEEKSDRPEVAQPAEEPVKKTTHSKGERIGWFKRALKETTDAINGFFVNGEDEEI